MSGEYVEPFGDKIWVTKSVYDENGEVNGAPFLSDLGDALKTAVHRNKYLGQSNQCCCAKQAHSRHLMG